MIKRLKNHELVLIEQLRKKFDSGDILDLACEFSYIKSFKKNRKKTCSFLSLIASFDNFYDGRIL
jgi:hypothetical protein